MQSSGSLRYLRLNDTPCGPMGARAVGEMLLMNDALTYVNILYVRAMAVDSSVLLLSCSISTDASGSPGLLS